MITPLSLSDAKDQQSLKKLLSKYMSGRNISDELMHCAGAAKKTEDAEGCDKTPVGSLPHQLLMEIFLRLPSESLVQLRPVCREWHEIITNEDFVQLHLEKWSSRGTNGILFMTISDDLSMSCGSSLGFRCQLATLSFYYDGMDLNIGRQTIQIEECIRRAMMNEYQEVGKFTWMNFSILDLCNGLLLLGITCDNIYRLAVCNPTTRSFKLLPRPGHPRIDRLYWSIVHDCSDRIHRIIGLSSKLLIFDFYEDGDCPITWRETNILHTAPYPSGVLASVYADQRIYFLTRCWNFGVASATVMYIDIVTGNIKDIPHFPTLPPISSPFDSQFSSDGKFFMAFNLWGMQLDLWVLSDMEKQTWERYRVVELESVYDLLPLDELRSRTSFPQPVTLFDKERKLLVKFGKTMLIFDMESNKWGRVEERLEAYTTIAQEYDMANLGGYVVHTSSLIGFGRNRRKINQFHS